MNNWKLGSVALGFALLVLASGCSGRVTPEVDAGPRCNLGPDVCALGSFYDSGDQLILSPDLDASFAAGTGITDGVQTLGSNSPEADDIRTGLGNSLMIAGAEIPPDDVKGFQGMVAYCGTAVVDCRGNTFSDAVALGYSYYLRYPNEVVDTANDVVMTRFAVLKTTLNADHVVFGVAARMDHQRQFEAGGTTFIRYSPAQSGGFVSGPRFADELPASGYAAYVGFANAHAQSSNREFLPFKAGNNHGGAAFGTGYSAMVFSFDGGEANFEHGYMDLFAFSSPDDGDSDGVQAVSIDHNHFLLALDGNFATPEYHPDYTGTVIATMRPSVEETYTGDESDIADNADKRRAGYDDNPDREFDLGLDGTNNTASSGLAFRLMANDDTEESLDFAMELVSIGNLGNSRTAAPSCYVPEADVACFVRESSPTGAGLLRLYGGGEVELDNNDAADGAPTFAAGVWQYNQIVYIDTMGTANDKTDDRLLGIVDLVGSIGGLIYDADPGTLPSP